MSRFIYIYFFQSTTGLKRFESSLEKRSWFPGVLCCLIVVESVISHSAGKKTQQQLQQQQPRNSVISLLRGSFWPLWGHAEWNGELLANRSDGFKCVSVVMALEPRWQGPVGYDGSRLTAGGAESHTIKRRGETRWHCRVCDLLKKRATYIIFMAAQNPTKSSLLTDMWHNAPFQRVGQAFTLAAPGVINVTRGPKNYGGHNITSEPPRWPETKTTQGRG